MPPRRHRGPPPTGELRSIAPSGVTGGRRPEKVCVQPASSSHRGLKMHPRPGAPPGLRAWRAQPSSGGLGQVRGPPSCPGGSAARGVASRSRGARPHRAAGKGPLSGHTLLPSTAASPVVANGHMYTQTHTHAHANTCTQVHTQGSQRHVHAHTCTERYVCNHRHTYLCTHTRMHKYTRVHSHPDVHVCT